jgi:hypothetical protein
MTYPDCFTSGDLAFHYRIPSLNLNVLHTSAVYAIMQARKSNVRVFRMRRAREYESKPSSICGVGHPGAVEVDFRSRTARQPFEPRWMLRLLEPAVPLKYLVCSPDN